MEETILVLGLSAYRFPDEQTGQMREGAHIYYVGDYAFAESDKKGTLPIKMGAMLDLYNGAQDKQYPALCKLESKTVPDGKGKPVVKPVRLHYLREVDLFAPAAVNAK